jgi:hypothetical protein
MGSAFTYQGRLADAGVPASGSFDFRFALFDAATGGSAVGATASIPAVAVTGGLFTAALDFGPAAFAGQARWLQVEVRPAGGGAYTALTPRQELTPAPHAGFSSRTDPANLTVLNASNLTSGVVPDARLAGVYGQPLSLTNAANALTGTFTGSGAGLTGLVASNLATGTVPGGVVAGTYPNALTLPNPANVLAGDGSALTNLNAQPAPRAHAGGGARGHRRRQRHSAPRGTGLDHHRRPRQPLGAEARAGLLLRGTRRSRHEAVRGPGGLRRADDDHPRDRQRQQRDGHAAPRPTTPRCATWPSRAPAAPPTPRRST